MRNKTYMFKAINRNSSILEIDPKDEEKLDSKVVLMKRENSGSSKLFIYRNETKKFEKVIHIKREITPDTIVKDQIAHQKIKYVKKELREKYFPGFPFYCDGDLVYKNYHLEYDEKMIDECFRYYPDIDYFSTIKETSITFETEDSGEITVDPNYIYFTTHVNYFDKYIITVKNDVMDIIEFTKFWNSSAELNYLSTMVSFNMKTGMCYLFPEKIAGATSKKDIKNITTGIIPFDLPDLVADKAVSIIQEYNKEKLGVDVECVKAGHSFDTIRSFNFNPQCNLMYYYKPFFNTRFRTYFKRDDVTINHFEKMCDMIGLPYSKDYFALCVTEPKNIFLAKCLYDAGIKKTENIISMINVIYDNCWDKYQMYDFIDKYYGEKTDFLYRELPSYAIGSNIREDLYKYITKAIPYTSEDEFVTMFVRSFVQHNKYWKRSLHQVATLIDLNDYGRELMRKACSYGLNKIQSDNIDLAYDKVLTKNKFIRYSSDELALEGSNGNFFFKLPIDMQEVADLASDIADKNVAENSSFEAARKFYNIIFVKDSIGEIVAFLKYRGNMLLEAKINKTSVKYDEEEIIQSCINWCDANEIKQYRCKDLKKNDDMWLPF